jgi:superfamily II DNA or RNA helicase
VAEYCQANELPVVKPFVLVSTKDTTHASQVRQLIESDGFSEGRYKGKVIEIHSGKTRAESDENIQRLLAVEQPTSNVEVVIHVAMLKEGWDVKNLYTIIPLRATVSEILAEQTIGRGLRLPFGKITGDPDLDALEIVSHDQYAKLIEAAKKEGTVTAYDFFLVRPLAALANLLHRFLDQLLIDRVLVHGPAAVVDVLGRGVKQVQNGEVHRYLVLLLLGAAVALGLALKETPPAGSARTHEPAMTAGMRP